MVVIRHLEILETDRRKAMGKLAILAMRLFAE